MKKISALIAVVLTVMAIGYMSNISYASKAGAPILISPSNGQTGVEVVPTFQYDLNGSTNCYLDVSRNSDLSDPVTSMSLSDLSTSKVCNVTLDNSTEYFWGVKPISEENYAQIRHFTTE